MKLLNLFKLKKEQNKTFNKGDFFVVTGGTYGGEYLLLMEQNEDNLHFFVLPDKKIRIIKEDVLTRGQSNRVVEYIENVPKLIFKECQYEYSLINKDV
jgi:hypothetical protein